jgi:hypothetical protein
LQDLQTAVSIPKSFMPENLKVEHEEAVAKDILKTLNLEAEFWRHGDDANEPDVLFKQQGKILGIEVATAYYDSHQAKMEWQLARGIIKPPPDKLIYTWSGSDFDEKIFQRIQQEITDKCSRKYIGADLFWLCIEHRGFLSDCDATENCVNKLTVPYSNIFDKIFILYTVNMNEGGGFRVFELPAKRQKD